MMIGKKFLAIISHDRDRDLKTASAHEGKLYAVVSKLIGARESFNRRRQR